MTVGLMGLEILNMDLELIDYSLAKVEQRSSHQKVCYQPLNLYSQLTRTLGRLYQSKRSKISIHARGIV